MITYQVSVESSKNVNWIDYHYHLVFVSNRRCISLPLCGQFYLLFWNSLWVHFVVSILWITSSQPLFSYLFLCTYFTISHIVLQMFFPVVRNKACLLLHVYRSPCCDLQQFLCHLWMLISFLVTPSNIAPNSMELDCYLCVTQLTRYFRGSAPSRCGRVHVGDRVWEASCTCLRTE